MKQKARKKIITTATVLLFVFALSGLTACTPEHDPSIPETKTPESENNSGYDENENHTMNNTIILRIGEKSFTAILEDNKAANTLAALLPLTVDMNELNGNEKYYYLSKHLPTESQRPGTIRNGDLMLYGSNCLVLFYKTFSSSYSYTRIGKITQPEGLSEALGNGKVSVTFEMNENQ